MVRSWKEKFLIFVSRCPVCGIYDTQWYQQIFGELENEE